MYRLVLPDPKTVKHSTLYRLYNIYIYCSFQHGSARVPYQSSFFSVGDSEICALIIRYCMYIFNLLPGRDCWHHGMKPHLLVKFDQRRGADKPKLYIYI